MNEFKIEEKLEYIEYLKTKTTLKSNQLYNIGISDIISTYEQNILDEEMLLKKGNTLNWMTKVDFIIRLRKEFRVINDRDKKINEICI